MKKVNKVFGLIVLCSFFSFQSASCSVMVEYILREIVKSWQNDIKDREDWQNRRKTEQEEKGRLRTQSSQGLTAVTALEIVPSPEIFMEERIKGLVNKTVNVGDKNVFLFPTPKLKIFVLQNIEDFLSLPKGDLLYKYVYQECIKQIRKLEKPLTRAVDKDENVFLVDDDVNNQKIDVVCQKYMQLYGVTKEKIKEHRKDRNVNWAKYKQNIVSKGLEDLIGQSVEKGKVLEVEDPVYQAHLFILAYLIYLAGDKASMMSKDEYKEKAGEVLKAQGGKSEKERLEELRKPFVSESIKDIKLGLENKSAVELQQEAKDFAAKTYSIKQWLNKEEGIKKAQNPHKKIHMAGSLSLGGAAHQVPKFTEKELPQEMTQEQQQEYAEKIQKLYPKKMSAIDRLKEGFWSLFGY